MRKHISACITAICLCLAGFAVSAQTYSNAVMGLNPAGYWPLNETAQPPQPINIIATNSGTLGAAGNGYYGAWYQASGNQWYLTNNIVTEPSPLTNGDPALNCQFAPGQYIILPRNTNGVANSALTIKPPFSIEAWVQVGTTGSQLGNIVSEGQVQMLAGGSNPTNPFYGGPTGGTSWAGFALGQYANFFFFSCYNTNAYNNKGSELDGPKNLTVGQWVYVVCTFDGTTETMYINGAQAGTKSVPLNAKGQGYVPDPTSPLMIGSGSDVPIDYGVSFKGGLAGVAIYNELLPQSSITAHYQTAGGTNSTYGTNYSAAVLADNPMLYFRMKDNQSQTNAGYPSASFPVANNYGTLGAAANGVYQPGTTPGVAGPSYSGFGPNSGAVAINGWLGAVDVGSSNIPSALNPTGAVPMTVVSWFQTGPADSPGRFQEIVGHSDSSYRIGMGQYPNVDEHFNPGPGPELDFANPSQSATNGFAFNDARWHMVAGVSDGTNAYLYLDGALALSNNNPAGIKIVGSSDDLLLGGAPQYTYANVNSSSQSIQNFDGQIAQVAYWTNALTAAQIQALFNAAGAPPYIWQEPLSSEAINAGQSLSISTGIRGGGLTYQWYQNGAPVSGETNSSLSYAPVTVGDAGTYYLVASNASGSVTSSVVTLTVYGPPIIIQQSPTSLEIFSNASPTLYVTASGESPNYQWSLNSTAIPGATNSSYTITNLASSGTYGCTLSNPLGTTNISPISVTMLADPTAPYPLQVLSNNPIAYYRLDEAIGTLTAYDYVGGLNGIYTNVVLGYQGFDGPTDPNETCAEFDDINPPNDYMGNVPSYLNFGTPNGSNAEFTVEAWVDQFNYIDNGDCIAGIGYGNGGEQFVLDTGAGTQGYLRFFVRNAGGTVSGASSTIQIDDGFWHHVVGVCDEAGGHVYLYLDGNQVASGTITNNTGILSSSTPLSIGARQSANNNGTNYDLQFDGDIDDVSFYNRALTSAQVKSDYLASGVPPLNVTVQPSTLVTNQGADITFTAAVRTGTQPLTYQWYDEHNNLISGQTTSNLVLSDVQSTQSGNYTLTVANEYGSTNVTFSVQINMGAAAINGTIQPAGVTNYVGTPITLSIVPTGSEPFYFQWYQNGAAVSGATNSSYTFADLLGDNSYYVVVSNAYSYSEGSGPVQSSPATVVGEAVSIVNPTNFTSQMKISFPGYNRSETLQCFPVLVRLSTSLTNFSYGEFTSPTGADLRFANAQGQELPYEINQWNGTNGVSTIWVQVPQLTATNSIWAYWGNPADTNPPAYTTNGAVWEPASFLDLPDYEVVYHLQQTNFPYLDSTLNYTSTNGVAPAAVGGLIGTGQLFNGSTQYLDAGDVNLGNQFTMSAWVDLSASESSILDVWANGKGGYNTNEVAMFINFYGTTDGGLLLGTGDGTSGDQPESTTGLIGPGKWHLVTASVDRGAGVVQLYVDGLPQGSGAAKTDFTTNADMYLGRFTSPNFPMNGIMNEARIHSGIDDTNWVWADYMTVASNSVFSAYSAVNTTPAPSANLTIQYIGGGKVVLNWTEGTLQSASVVTGPYTNVTGATAPYTNTVSAAQQFYRVQLP